MSARIARQDNWDLTTVAGQLRKNIWQRTTRTGQPEEVSMRGQPRQASLDRTERTSIPGYDSKDRITVSGGL
jgi:hypothetical protein